MVDLVLAFNEDFGWFPAVHCTLEYFRCKRHSKGIHKKRSFSNGVVNVVLYELNSSIETCQNPWFVPRTVKTFASAVFETTSWIVVMGWCDLFSLPLLSLVGRYIHKGHLSFVSLQSPCLRHSQFVYWVALPFPTMMSCSCFAFFGVLHCVWKLPRNTNYCTYRRISKLEALQRQHVSHKDWVENPWVHWCCRRYGRNLLTRRAASDKLFNVSV